MTTPENTSKRPNEVHLLGAMSDGASGYIEGMEADGQRQLVNSTVLPREILHGPEEEFTALGFTFGEPTDDLFREATLPEGWSRKGSDHAMWSYIVDERGVERVAIFYKAAFYDRRAHMSLSRVGSSLASSFIYGDGPDETPWDVLTNEERADFISSLTDYVERAAEHPDIYGDRLPRVEAALALRAE